MKDIWPDRDEVNALVKEVLSAEFFRDFYANTLTRNERWNNLKAPTGNLFTWSDESTYIHHPPFFQNMSKEASTSVEEIQDANVLCLFGDSVTTDHISPAGNIARTSVAAKFLAARGV